MMSNAEGYASVIVTLGDGILTQMIDRVHLSVHLNKAFSQALVHARGVGLIPSPSPGKGSNDGALFGY
jgi:hypothetical protein